MRFLIVESYYPEVLRQVYSKNPGLLNQSYEQQLSRILNQSFGTADFYSKNLRPLHHECQDIVANCELLQKTWAREHQAKYSNKFLSQIPVLRIKFRSDWEKSILKQQIENFNPDVLLLHDPSILTPELKTFVKKKKTFIVAQVAAYVPDKETANLFDLILTSSPHFVSRIKTLGTAAEYFRIGFEETIISRLEKSSQQYGAVFVGGFSKHHMDSVEAFEYAAKNSQIDFWGYGAKKKLSPDSPILRTYHPEMVFGIDMYNILYNSKIAINRHIKSSENFANNMRLYETTGVGTMLLTDRKSNLGKLFKVGSEVEDYGSKEEMVEKINYYLKHDDKRLKIAKAGQRRTLRDHTYKKRMIELTEILEKYI